MNKIWIGLVASAFALAAPAYAIVAAPIATGQSSANSYGPFDSKRLSSSGSIATSSTGRYYYDANSYGSSSNILNIDIGKASLVSETHTIGKGYSGANSGSVSTLSYYFSITGPTPTVLIEISAIAKLSRSAFSYIRDCCGDYGARYNQYAEVIVIDDHNKYIFGGLAQSIFENGPNSTMFTAGMFTLPGMASNTTNPITQAFSGIFAGSKIGRIDTNRQYSVYMNLQDSITLHPYNLARDVSSYASLSNLSVKLASTVVNPSDYQLSFGNPAAVPEPASWAMLIVGFGLTGAMMRRRKHNPSLG